MALSGTPSSARKHIGIFGRRNAGKSSLLNAIASQDLAVVSPVKGTTTDAVSKAMEILPAGPVLLIDTPGLDDDGIIGSERVKRARKALSTVDAALVVIDAATAPDETDLGIIMSLKDRSLPYIVVINKIDAIDGEYSYRTQLPSDAKILAVSSVTKAGIDELKTEIGRMLAGGEEKPLARDLFNPGDTVVLVIPIDKSAPKGRLILPQQQTIRDILDGNGSVMMVKEDGLEKALAVNPSLVITDSQVFGLVSRIVPDSIPLTSFSILFARYKGGLECAVRGVKAVESLKDGDRVLISEGCTHHRQCGDIGRDKIPLWLLKRTGKELSFDFSSGTGFPDDLSPYSLIVHCGGCMLTEGEMGARRREAEAQGIPMTNYGILIAYINGILSRSLSVFPDIQRLL